MDTPWIIWLAVIAISFAVLERYAFRHPERANTLSRFVWQLGQTWPLSIALASMMVGGLMVHFLWHWCPDLMPAGVGG